MWPSEPDLFRPDHVEPEGAKDGPCWYFAFLGSELVCKSVSGSIEPLNGDDFRWLDLDMGEKHYVGMYEGNHCFAVRGKGASPEGYIALDLRGILGRVQQPIFYLSGRAKQILDWAESHEFCGRCGEKTDYHKSDRAKICRRCSLICYPRLSPSIIVLVTRGEEMLLARNVNWPAGMYSTLAGFVESGESIEQTVHREVFEEVGLRVKELKYFGSQSWPFPNSLMLGFHAEYKSGEIVCQAGEIADAKWFTRDSLPQTPPKTAISGWLIEEFAKSLA